MSVSALVLALTATLFAVESPAQTSSPAVQALANAATKTRLNKVIQQARDNKYYEANLALKAIEDGITVDSVSVTDAPKK